MSCLTTRNTQMNYKEAHTYLSLLEWRGIGYKRKKRNVKPTEFSFYSFQQELKWSVEWRSKLERSLESMSNEFYQVALLQMMVRPVTCSVSCPICVFWLVHDDTIKHFLDSRHWLGTYFMLDVLPDTTINIASVLIPY